MSITSASKSFMLCLFQVVFGVFSFGFSGLIGGQVISQLHANLRLAKNVLVDISDLDWLERHNLIRLMVKYSKFPKFVLPAEFLNISSNQLPILMLGIMYSPAIAGLYVLADRMIVIPVNLITTSIGQVYYKATQLKCKLPELALLTQKLLQNVVHFCNSHCNFCNFFREIFKFAFGENWAEAGKFAGCLF